MRATFTQAVEDKDQLNYTVTVPKYIMARLVDYFFFNTDHNPYFDGKGQLEGIEGVPKELINLLKVCLQVEMDRGDWEALLSNEFKGYDKESLRALAEAQLND